MNEIDWSLEKDMAEARGWITDQNICDECEIEYCDDCYLHETYDD